MSIVLNGLVLFIAFLHLSFLILEMFFWTKPLGLKVFRQSKAQAEGSAVLAANQGLYNGFLAAGLIWGLLHPVAEFAWEIQSFFLVCVFVAGVYGGISVSRGILYIQAIPAALALLLLFLSKYKKPTLLTWVFCTCRMRQHA